MTVESQRAGARVQVKVLRGSCATAIISELALH